MHTGLVTPSGRPITRFDVARARFAAETRGGAIVGRRANEGAETDGTFLGGWQPALGSADRDWLWDRNNVVARARDASRNDVVGASAGSRKVNRAIGRGWRLASRVNARALGITPDQAAELRQQIETEFRLYAYGAGFKSDAERKKTFGQNLRLAAAHMFHDGEALGTVEWAADEPTKYKTRLRLVDPDRLSNPSGQPDSALLRGGVQRDRAGRVDGYWIREGHPCDVGVTPNFTWNYWPRFSTPLERPQVLHAFEEKRAGQSRGVSAFVSVLKSLRGLNRFKDMTLEAVTINAMMVAFAKSSAGPAAVSEHFTADDLVEFEGERQSSYEEHPVTINGARIPVLPLGDEIQMQHQARDTAGFDPFVRSILRLIAAALGITYEELSMDFSQTNYSSARAALAIAWDELLTFRSLIADQIANPFFVAFLEEAFDIGAIVPPARAPDFYDAVDAYSECLWIAPGKGVIDPTKEIDAAAARIEANLSTLERECAEDGEDWRDVLEQKAIEKFEMERLGIHAPGGALGAAGGSSRDPVRDNNLETRPSALARIAGTARDPQHLIDLDRRPV